MLNAPTKTHHEPAQLLPSGVDRNAIHKTRAFLEDKLTYG